MALLAAATADPAILPDKATWSLACPVPAAITSSLQLRSSTAGVDGVREASGTYRWRLKPTRTAATTKIIIPNEAALTVRATMRAYRSARRGAGNRHVHRVTVGLGGATR